MSTEAEGRRGQVEARASVSLGAGPGDPETPMDTEWPVATGMDETILTDWVLFHRAGMHGFNFCLYTVVCADCVSLCGQEQAL